MLECLAVGGRDDEANVAFALGPVERERDLIRALPHGCGAASLATATAFCVGGAGAGWTGGGGSAGGFSELAWIRTTVPAKSTIQPRALNAAASCEISPWYWTRM